MDDYYPKYVLEQNRRVVAQQENMRLRDENTQLKLILFKIAQQASGIDREIMDTQEILGQLIEELDLRDDMGQP